MTDKPVSVYFTAENRTFWLHGLFWGLVTLGPVSYTHLDVYKRQRLSSMRSTAAPSRLQNVRMLLIKGNTPH